MKKPTLPDGQEIERHCPKCGPAAKLVIRTNRTNGSQFCGCPNWPDCTYTEEVPPALLAEAGGQPKLF